MWMYSGFTSVSTLAGDVKDKSVVWKSLLIALPIIALTYILPTAAGVGAVGNWQEWGSDSVNYGTVAGLVGLSGAFIFVAIIGNASCFNTCMASLSRNFYAICEDNLGPKMMVKMSKKRSIPYISVLSIAIVALIGCTFNFETIITITVTMLMVDYTLIWISLVALRIKHPEMKRPFKIPVKSVPGIIAFVSSGMDRMYYSYNGEWCRLFPRRNDRHCRIPTSLYFFQIKVRRSDKTLSGFTSDESENKTCIWGFNKIC